MPSKTKTEHRAVNTLEAIIDEHLTMDHQFNGNDKEMSWDGYIWLYKNNSGASSKLDSINEQIQELTKAARQR